jgi:hypothetical protein
MRPILVVLAAVALGGCASAANGPALLSMGVEVPCDLPAEELRQLRGRTNAMERIEKAELSRSLALVDAAAILGGDVRAIRQGLIDRSNANLRLAIGLEADIACGFAAPRPQTQPTQAPRPFSPTVHI